MPLVSEILSGQLDQLVVGEMTETVDVERSTTTVNDYGETETTWTVLHADVPATVMQEGAGEAIEAGRVTADAAYAARIAYEADITTDDRLKWRGDVLAIHSLRDVQTTKSILEIKASRAGE